MDQGLASWCAIASSLACYRSYNSTRGALVCKRCSEYAESFLQADPAMAYAGIEATRIQDGSYVFIKCLTSPLDAPLENEVSINQFLSTEPQHSDPRNHCAPLLDTFVEQQVSVRHTFMVFPFLRNLRMTPFRLAVELLSLTKQLLEVRYSPHPSHTF